MVPVVHHQSTEQMEDLVPQQVGRVAVRMPRAAVLVEEEPGRIVVVVAAVLVLP